MDPDTRWRLISLVPLPAELVAGLLGDLPVDVVTPDPLTPEAARALAGDADLLLATWSSDLPVDAQLLAAAPKLAAIQQPSVGVDGVDVDEAARRGIPVANVAGFNAQSVAEWCLGAAYACMRLLVVADSEVRAGGWPQIELAGRGARELAGARVGIVGFGAIGQACARLLQSLGCDVGQWSRRQRDEEPWFELAELVARSEVLIVVVALGDQTRGLLDADLLATMPPGAVLINAARGGIVDEQAVARLVDDGHLSAAAFDVYATEPLPLDSPLRTNPRILLSPHAAGSTRQSQLRLLAGIKANLTRAMTGEDLIDVVNGVSPSVVRRDGSAPAEADGRPSLG